MLSVRDQKIDPSVDHGHYFGEPVMLWLFRRCFSKSSGRIPCVVAMFTSVFDLGLRSHARHGRCSIESSMSHPSQHVVIVGGGTAGISVAARFRHRAPALRITVIDPSETHYYQPLWTLVGGGCGKKEETARPESSVIPDGVKWLKQSVTEFLPDQNHVVLSSGERLGYDYFGLCPGIQPNWSEIKGLSGHAGQDGICSNYAYEFVDQTFPTIQAVQDGNALFTHPATPIGAVELRKRSYFGGRWFPSPRCAWQSEGSCLWLLRRSYLRTMRIRCGRWLRVETSKSATSTTWSRCVRPRKKRCSCGSIQRKKSFIPIRWFMWLHRWARRISCARVRWCCEWICRRRQRDTAAHPLPNIFLLMRCACRHRKPVLQFASRFPSQTTWSRKWMACHRPVAMTDTHRVRWSPAKGKLVLAEFGYATETDGIVPHLISAKNGCRCIRLNATRCRFCTGNGMLRGRA